MVAEMSATIFSLNFSSVPKLPQLKMSFFSEITRIERGARKQNIHKKYRRAIAADALEVYASEERKLDLVRSRSRIL
jgi:hypothetical protein